MWIFISIVLAFTYLVCSIVVSVRNRSFKGFKIVCKRFAILGLDLVFFALLIVAAIIALPILICSKDKREPEKITVEDLKPGDIIMTGNNSLSPFSICIKIANILTNGIDSKYWTHIAIHIGNGELIEAQTTGVRSISIQHYFERHSLIRVFRHKYLNQDNSPDFFNKLVAYCRHIEQNGTQYGFGALFYYSLSIAVPNILNWVFNEPFYDKILGIEDKYFCSELAAEAYEECGERISQYDSWRIKPSDFIINPLFKEVKFIGVNTEHVMKKEAASSTEP